MQLLEGFLIGGVPRTLPENFFVPLETMIQKALQDTLRGAGFFAGGIEIFHAQQPTPPVPAGVKITRQSGDQRS